MHTTFQTANIPFVWGLEQGDEWERAALGRGLEHLVRRRDGRSRKLADRRQDLRRVRRVRRAPAERARRSRQLLLARVRCHLRKGRRGARGRARANRGVRSAARLPVVVAAAIVKVGCLGNHKPPVAPSQRVVRGPSERGTSGAHLRSIWKKWCV